MDETTTTVKRSMYTPYFNTEYIKPRCVSNLYFHLAKDTYIYASVNLECCYSKESAAYMVWKGKNGQYLIHLTYRASLSAFTILHQVNTQTP